MQALTAIPSRVLSKKEAQREGQTLRQTEDRGSLEVRAQTPIAVKTDLELIEAFRSGNERAFAELYTRYKSEIYTFCLRMLGGDGAEAGDAYQETFIKVYEKLDTFRYGDNVKGWIYMIARNVALNIYRSKRPEETIENHPYLESTERHLSPEFAGEQQTLRIALEEAIATLPIAFRKPFILREFDGLSYPEIARITGLSLPLTKVRIHRAKQRLRKLLAPIITDETYRSNDEQYELEEEIE